MGERRGTKGLELWCRKMTEGYPGVKIDNMTTSWRDGLAFCAMIHHFRPDLIEFSKLNKDDIYTNNELAFRIAEDHLGIPALLEPEDMVECSVPDRLSILTYLSQFYQAFAVNQSNSQVKTPPKRAADLQMHMVTAQGSNPPKKAATRNSSAFREPCAKCGLPVFIAERINVGKALFHRSCFRCARCDSQLALESYYETENDQYCCETCPDEEEKLIGDAVANLLQKSVSDEEKTASLKHESDLYSSNFEDFLENVKDKSLKRDFTFARDAGGSFAAARNEFMSGQLDRSSSESETDSGHENKPPDITRDVAEERRSENTIDVASAASYGGPSEQRNDPLPSFSDSGLPSFKLTRDLTQTRPEDGVVVTKDASSERQCDPASLSIRSRIRLFETDAAKPTSKFGVGKQVPHVLDTVDKLSRPIYSKNEVLHSEKEEDHHPDSSFLLEKEESALSDENSSVKEESVIVISSDNSSLTKVVKSPSAREENSNVLTISSSSSSDTSRGIPEQPKASVCSVVLTISDTSEEPSALSLELENSTSAPPDDKEPPRPSRRSAKIREKSPIEADIVNDHRVEYPDDLNPFGDDVEDVRGDVERSTSKSVSLNPFGDSEEEEEEVVRKPEVAPRRLISAKGLNPFGSEEDEDDEDVDDGDDGAKMVTLPPQPAVRKLIKAPKISLPQYWNDDLSPVAKPRSPRRSSDSSSLTGSGRKKKPAPRPPLAFQDNTESPASSICSSPSHSVCHSPKSTIRGRKMKRAPLPPTSTPIKTADNKEGAGVPQQTDGNGRRISNAEEDVTRALQFRTGSEENLKSAKDESNRNKQNVSSPIQNDGPSSLPNKSTYGKWKRRKGQAPPRPIPQKRHIQSIPMGKIKHELEMIEVQMIGLEKHGVKLEQLIRQKSEGPDTNEDEALPPEVEDMIIQLFELVNEKNELSRKQAELMYIRRQHRLEEEQAEIEYQIRCLMLEPEYNKTDCDKSREEELINRLLEIVERRNQIVDCLEMDRKRAADEDTSISSQMNLYAMKRDEEIASAQKKLQKKEKQKHKKDKEKKSKSKGKFDADKDIDESEVPSMVKEKKKKKKFNIF